MRSRTTRLLATGLLALSLTGCAGFSPPVIVQCPAIPKALTTECVPPSRQLDTNGDLARAILDARECLAITSIQLRAIAELSDCRASAQRAKQP